MVHQLSFLSAYSTMSNVYSGYVNEIPLLSANAKSMCFLLHAFCQMFVLFSKGARLMSYYRSVSKGAHFMSNVVTHLSSAFTAVFEVFAHFFGLLFVLFLKGACLLSYCCSVSTGCSVHVE